MTVTMTDGVRPKRIRGVSVPNDASQDSYAFVLDMTFIVCISRQVMIKLSRGIDGHFVTFIQIGMYLI